ncbi:MAG: hypothetical protein WD100_10055 [Tistlia sp.]|uniref:bestrophin-like domain n=1 Tax=Tistlia sp. TaxID=3057121 RepID=UPI0034A21084
MAKSPARGPAWMHTLFGLFDRPPLYQFVAIAIWTGLAWGAGRLLLGHLNRRFRLDGGVLPVAPFFVSVTTLFALFLGFLAADIWAEKRRASDAAYAERAALERFVTLSGPEVLDAADALAAAERYRRRVIEQEWGAARNGAADPETEAALRAMWSAAARLTGDASAVPASGHLFVALEGLSGARSDRLSIGAAHGGSTAWYSVLALWVFSFAALAVVHLDRPAAGRLAMTVFALATSVAFFFLILHDSPYGGGVRIDPSLLAELPVPPTD